MNIKIGTARVGILRNLIHMETCYSLTLWWDSEPNPIYQFLICRIQSQMDRIRNPASSVGTGTTVVGVGRSHCCIICRFIAVAVRPTGFLECQKCCRVAGLLSWSDVLSGENSCHQRNLRELLGTGTMCAVR